MGWRRFDTLFVRLFVLMWVALVASHFIAFTSVTSLRGAGPGAAPARGLDLSHLPTLPSLPPGNPFGGTGDNAGGPGHRPPPGGPGGPGGDLRPPPPPDGGPLAGSGPGGLPRESLWLDYALRMAVIALAALLGARWLSTPMRRLGEAATAVGEGLARGQPLPALDASRGTREVRQAASVFNQMATRLQQQFDARGLQMAALSHDLRTPLTRLRMRAERLPPHDAAAAADDIREMDEMIDSTLAVLREQQEGAAAQNVDMAALLQAICDDLAEQGHTVALYTPAALRVRAHPAALRRIVGNLVGNALRYGQSAELSLVAGEAGRVEVRVDDRGPGIPGDQVELAFKPWVRLAGAHGRSGHGLGLAIARDLAERDGGTLTLHNRPEGGLRACLSLPAG